MTYPYPVLLPYTSILTEYEILLIIFLYKCVVSYICLQDPIHLYRACCFMEWCAVEMPDTEQHAPDRPASLFEGLLGRLYLAADITSPEDATFPAFSL